MDYSDFIEWLLQKNNKEYYVTENYFCHQSFFTEDTHKSCLFFKNGIEHIYNAPINGKNRFTIKEIVIMLGYLDEYIQWCMKELNIPTYVLNKYREKCTLFECNMSDKNDYYKQLTPLTKNYYISKSELQYGSLIKPKEFVVKKKKRIINSSPPTYRKPDNFEIEEINKYMEKRKIKVSDYVFPEIFILPSKIEIKAICLLYPNGYRKYRLIKGDLRYLSMGSFEELYIAHQKDNNSILIICEGEIEAISLSYLLPDNIDIMALHNCSTFKSSLDFKKYKKIIVVLDKDKFEESKEVLEKDLTKREINAIITYKIKNEKEDYNSLYCCNKYEEMLENINKYLKEE